MNQGDNVSEGYNMSPRGKNSKELYQNSEELLNRANELIKYGIGSFFGSMGLRYDEEIFEAANYSVENAPELYNTFEPLLQTGAEGATIALVGMGGMNLIEGKLMENKASRREDAEMIAEALEPDENEGQ